ncbi:MAG: HEAT repeat domain-containing protein [Bryobacteraceae bacterium]
MRLSSRFIACAAFTCLLLAGQNNDGLTQKERISRIRDLGKRDSGAIPALSAYLSNPDPEVRFEAVKSIVRIGGEASLDPLVQATHDKNPDVQVRATNGLVNFYLPGYVAKGLTAPVTRGARQAKALFANRNDQVIDPSVSVKPEIPDALAAEINGPAIVEVKTNAARAAGILRARSAVPALAGALRHKDSGLIMECLVALQKIKDPAVGTALGGPARDLDERVKITALETIGKLRSLEAAPDVRLALSSAGNLKVRRAALEALAMLGLSGDRATFQHFVTERDPELRASALEGLGRIREPEDYPLLERAYNEKDADARVHLAAAFALTEQGKVDTNEYSPLLYLFDNLALKARSSAAEAYLAELVRRPEVRTALIPMIPNGSKEQKLALCSVLTDAQSEEVLPVLSNLTTDKDPDVAVAAAKAMKIVKARQSAS